MSTTRLVDDPFDFIGKPSKPKNPKTATKQKEFTEQKSDGTSEKSQLDLNASRSRGNKNHSESSQRSPERWVRATFIITPDMRETIRSDAFWKRKEINQVVREIFDRYYENRKIKPIPNTIGPAPIED